MQTNQLTMCVCVCVCVAVEIFDMVCDCQRFRGVEARTKAHPRVLIFLALGTLRRDIMLLLPSAFLTTHISFKGVQRVCVCVLCFTRQHNIPKGVVFFECTDNRANECSFSFASLDMDGLKLSISGYRGLQVKNLSH